MCTSVLKGKIYRDQSEGPSFIEHGLIHCAPISEYLTAHTQPKTKITTTYSLLIKPPTSRQTPLFFKKLTFSYQMLTNCMKLHLNPFPDIAILKSVPLSSTLRTLMWVLCYSNVCFVYCVTLMRVLLGACPQSYIVHVYFFVLCYSVCCLVVHVDQVVFVNESLFSIDIPGYIKIR